MLKVAGIASDGGRCELLAMAAADPFRAGQTRTAHEFELKFL